MRIISGFHDYYDPISKNDHDRETLFIRATSEAPPIKIPVYDWYTRDADLGVLWFCGVPYKRARLSIWDSFRSQWADKVDCITYEAAENWYRQHRSAHYFSRLKKAFYGPLRELRQFFDWKPEDAYPQVPIWWCSKKSTLNPRIMDIWPGFVKIMNPTDAYRELVTWHSKVARPEPKIPEIPNDTKIEAAGFNLKTSFRKKKQS